MRNNMKTRNLIFCMLLALLMSAAAASKADGGTVYDELYREFTRYDNRLPGSSNLESCFKTLEGKLSEAGLQVHRQTYATLVPRTRVCEFTVEGVKVGPVFSLAPNDPATYSNGKNKLEGPLVWVGDGSYAEMKGKEIDGSIVLMNFGSPYMDNVFLEGARAVIFVGNDNATQWNVSNHFTEVILPLPRAYISKADAEKAGLFSDNGQRNCTLDLRVVWEDAAGCNLWTLIPGSGKKFNLDAEEVIFLSATLDTFGAVPDLCPQNRSAANAALLGELACSLAKEKTERSILIVFYGSHYAAQDGARHFLYALGKRKEGGFNKHTIEEMAEAFKQEKKDVEAYIELLKSNDFINMDSTEAFNVTKFIEQDLRGRVNNYNYNIGQIYIEKNKNKKPEDESRFAEWKKKDDELTVKRDELEKKRGIINNLQRELSKDREIKDLENFRLVREDLRKHQEKRLEDITAMLRDNESAQEIIAATKGKKIVTHFHFDFASDKHDWVPAMMGDAWTMLAGPTKKGDFVRNISVLAELYNEVASPEWKARFAVDEVEKPYIPSSLSLPREKGNPASLSICFGIFGYQLLTVGDALNSDELPVRIECSLSGLTDQLAEYMKKLADDEKLSIQSPMQDLKPFELSTYFYRGEEKYYGIRFLNMAKGSTELEGPARGSISIGLFGDVGGNVNASNNLPVITGHTRYTLDRINVEGYIFCPRWGPVKNERNVFIGLGFNGEGEIERISDVAGRRERLFYCYGGGLHMPFFPEKYGTPSVISVLNAGTDSKFQMSFVQFNERHCVFYFDRQKNFKLMGTGILMLGSLNGKERPGIVLTDRIKDRIDPEGIGYTVQGRDVYNQNPIELSATDYAILDASRIEILRKRNIVNDSVEILHAEAKQHLDEAKESRIEQDRLMANAHELFSLGLSYRAYQPLKDVANDLVKAVVILLLLNIPFAFAMERLIFGFTNIYKQVGGFAGFFIATFLILYMVHPAFSLAQAPVIIFLAFVIVMMSSVVIYIVASKFRKEVREIQGLGSTVHGVASDSSTALASVNIGISCMRNRPLKTFLTATTVVLLTFTILAFASFTSKVGLRDTYLGKGQGDERIEMHRFSFLYIPDSLYTAIGSMYSEKWNVFRRTATFFNPTSKERNPEKVIYNPETKISFELDAILGFDSGEVKVNADLNEMLPGLSDDENGIPPLFLSDISAAQLKVEKGQILRIGGQPFVFAGVFETGKFQGFTNLDGTSIAPPDFKSTFRGAEKIDSEVSQLEGGGESVDIGNFVWFPPQKVAITTNRGMRVFDAIPNFISLYPKVKGQVNVKKAGRTIANIFKGPIYAKGADGTWQFFFTKIMEGSGFSEVIVPLLLGGLIIFSSLLGSIVDRKKEIFTDSALGLAPPDVAALFFAESSVYAVVGGLGGYLFSQVVVKVLSIMASYGLMQAPEMNFSSLSSVMTILVVMATVLLSTVYPAVKAGKSANPGVARKWKMPEPDGDHLSFIFPFTVSYLDMAGILSFISEHFRNHGDASIGSFASRDVKLFTFESEGEDSVRYGIEAMISLAPFDLGVFQKFRMYSKESEIEGIREVVVELHRINGAPGTWMRSNRGFINDLRNQFLLWRSLPVETVEHYRSMTEHYIEDNKE